MKSKWPKVLGLALLGACAACSREAPSDSDESIPPAAAPAQAPASAVPAGQANLLKLIAAVDANTKDEAAFNRFCDTFEKTPDFSNWTGTVADVQTSTVNGAIDITFSMGKHLRLEPVVQKTDPVYAAVEALTVGDHVTLSGRFSHNKGSSECTYYLGSFAASLTKVTAG
jgi:hypothetical protein